MGARQRVAEQVEVAPQLVAAGAEGFDVRPQLRRHRVERPGEPADLVTPPQSDPRVEVARGDPLRRLAHLSEWGGDRVGQPERDQDAGQQCGEQDAAEGEIEPHRGRLLHAEDEAEGRRPAALLSRGVQPRIHAGGPGQPADLLGEPARRCRVQRRRD
jgi:hypothetical protein